MGNDLTFKSCILSREPRLTTTCSSCYVQYPDTEDSDWQILATGQAIAAATGNFSEIFRWHDVGTIKPGCRADVLVLDENPLADTQNLRKICLLLLQGKIIEHEKLLAQKQMN